MTKTGIQKSAFQMVIRVNTKITEIIAKQVIGGDFADDIYDIEKSLADDHLDVSRFSNKITEKIFVV